MSKSKNPVSIHVSKEQVNVLNQILNKVFELRFIAREVHRLQRNGFYKRYLASYGLMCSIANTICLSGNNVFLEELDNIVKYIKAIQDMIVVDSGQTGSILFNSLHVCLKEVLMIKAQIEVSIESAGQ